MTPYKNAFEEATLSIVSFTSSGNGLGYLTRPDGTKVSVEVPFAIPGDTVKVKLLSRRRGVRRALLDSIVTPSRDRIAARCAHFASCGGCRWQQINYDDQLKLKEQLVRKCFSQQSTEGVVWHSIVKCDPPWEYRNKMEFTFSNNAAKESFLGLIIDSTKGRVLNLTECHLVHGWFMDGLKAARQWWAGTELEAYHRLKNTGSLRTLTMREGYRTGDRMIMLTVSGHPDYALNREHLQSFVTALRSAIEPKDRQAQLSIFLRVQQVAKGVATNFYEMVLHGSDHIREKLLLQDSATSEPQPVTFKISPQAFFQPNTRQAERLYSLAISMAEIPENGVVYDLYCGTGTLGICAARHARKVIGIELSPESALDARTNVADNGLNNVTIVTGDVGRVLPQIRESADYEQPSVVLVDPPRAGLDERALEHLIALGAKRIVYISCNPVTQAANVAALVAAGYRLMAIQPVDQFPQTVHVENIAILDRCAQ